MTAFNLFLGSLCAGALVLAPAVAETPDQTNASQSHGHMGHSGQGEHCGMPMGEGELQSIDVAKSKVTIAHKAIEAIEWPEMTMEFAVKKPVDLAAFAPGEKVHFMLRAEKDKKYSVAMMCSMEAEAGAHEACMKSMHDQAMKMAADSGMKCEMGGDAHSEHDQDAAGETQHGNHH